MCFSISNVINLNNFCGELYQFYENASPNQEDIDACCSYHRQNDLKCIAAGGCTFIGTLLPLIGGWFWILSGASCSMCGNLVSYRYSRTTQEQLDLEANVKRLVKEEPQSSQAIKDIFTRLKMLEEANARLQEKIIELENKPVCEKCCKDIKAHVIKLETKPNQLKMGELRA